MGGKTRKSPRYVKKSTGNLNTSNDKSLDLSESLDTSKEKELVEEVKVPNPVISPKVAVEEKKLSISISSKSSDSDEAPQEFLLNIQKLPENWDKTKLLNSIKTLGVHSKVSFHGEKGDIYACLSFLTQAELDYAKETILEGEIDGMKVVKKGENLEFVENLKEVIELKKESESSSSSSDSEDEKKNAKQLKEEKKDSEEVVKKTEVAEIKNTEVQKSQNVEEHKAEAKVEENKSEHKEVKGTEHVKEHKAEAKVEEKKSEHKEVKATEHVEKHKAEAKVEEKKSEHKEVKATEHVEEHKAEAKVEEKKSEHKEVKGSEHVEVHKVETKVEEKKSEHKEVKGNEHVEEHRAETKVEEKKPEEIEVKKLDHTEAKQEDKAVKEKKSDHTEKVETDNSKSTTSIHKDSKEDEPTTAPKHQNITASPEIRPNPEDSKIVLEPLESKPEIRPSSEDRRAIIEPLETKAYDQRISNLDEVSSNRISKSYSLEVNDETINEKELEDFAPSESGVSANCKEVVIGYEEVDLGDQPRIIEYEEVGEVREDAKPVRVEKNGIWPWVIIGVSVIGVALFSLYRLKRQ